MTTKIVLAQLPWLGLRFKPSRYLELLSKLPETFHARDVLNELDEDERMRLSFEKDWTGQIARIQERLHGLGASLITIADEDYPSGLREFRDAPLALTLMGRPCWREYEGISIVGSRHPSMESLKWLDYELDVFLQREEVFVASGGARGVDQKAHAVALRKNRPTVIFVPAGLGALYPQNLMEWIEPVTNGGGCLISTYAPDRRMDKSYFVERNRYIAALTSATLVVEARRRSGTMITARWAQSLERELAVVPCSPSATGLGGLDLIADGGATLIRDAADLSALLGRATVKCLPLFSRIEFQR